MTGFPGEDDAAFERTVSLVEALPFSYLHVFPYSERPGTDAAARDGAVAGEVRERRARLLREVGVQKKEQFQRRFHGDVRLVLVEGPREGLRYGVTDNYVRVVLKDYEGPPNIFVSAQLAWAGGVVWASPAP